MLGPLKRVIAVPLLNLAYHSGIYRALGAIYAGSGVIFSLHRIVRPDCRVLHPVHLLRSDLLDEMLVAVSDYGWDIVGIETVLERLSSDDSESGARRRRFVCFTLDDGYADSLTVALPIFRRHRAPLCVYVTTGMVERSIFYWWGANHEMILKSHKLELPLLDGSSLVLGAQTQEEKQKAYYALDALCNQLGESYVPVLRDLYRQNGVDPELCLDRDALSVHQLRALAADPLVTIGSHCVTHQRLSGMADDEVRFELQGGRSKLEKWLGVGVRHLAYPFGRSDSCGAREFELARQAGFNSALTTRPGNVFIQHRDHLQNLPRRSIPVDRFGLRNALYGIETVLRSDSRLQIN